MDSVSSTNSVQQVTGGLDLESFIWLVQSERANNLESQLTDQVKAVKDRQDQIRQFTEWLSAIRNARPSGDDPSKQGGTINSQILKDIQAYDHGNQLGISTPITQEECDKCIETLKGWIDTANSTSQIDMIRLQSLSNKRNEAFEQLSNLIQKLAKAQENVIGNMR